jgi:hypothetical protein
MNTTIPCTSPSPHYIIKNAATHPWSLLIATGPQEPDVNIFHSRDQETTISPEIIHVKLFTTTFFLKKKD